jgi:hypothetical protein
MLVAMSMYSNLFLIIQIINQYPILTHDHSEPYYISDAFVHETKTNILIIPLQA